MRQNIYYATSSDGTTWLHHSGPVLEYNVVYPWVLKDGSIYKMWYTDGGGVNNIKYATSSDGISWTKLTSSYLAGGGSTVLKSGGTYSMWFQRDDAIHYATSPDGINWTQHGIVLDISGSGAWDDTVVSQPVVIDDGSHKMWYAGWDGSTHGVGYATLSSNVLCVPVDAISQTCPNELDVGSGWLDISILGLPVDVYDMPVDVYDIDVASIRVLGVAPVRSSYEDVGDPSNVPCDEKDETTCNTLVGDGLMDLSMQFKCREIVKAIENSLGQKVKDGNVICLTLNGELIDSTPITGEDYVIIKKTGEKGKPDKPDKPDNPNKPPKKNASQEALSLSSGTSGVSGFQQ
jgi:hypothetical protein